MIALKNNAEYIRLYERHGSPYDRGAADSWYGRPFEPHYYEAGTNLSPRIELDDMTPAEVKAYTLGYGEQEESGQKKDWG